MLHNPLKGATSSLLLKMKTHLALKSVKKKNYCGLDQEKQEIST